MYGIESIHIIYAIGANLDSSVYTSIKEISDEEKLSLAKEHYHVIATNANEKSMTAKEIVHFYRKRRDTSEKQIKELKNSFNLNYLPSSNFISIGRHWNNLSIKPPQIPSFTHSITLEYCLKYENLEAK